jgi:hypothetical protein
MSGSINFDKDNNVKKSNADIAWKATAIGLGLGVLVMTGTVGVVARQLIKQHGLKGAALVTTVLSTIGGGAIKHGGKGIAGGVVRLCTLGGVTVTIGTATSTMVDIRKSRKKPVAQ